MLQVQNVASICVLARGDRMRECFFSCRNAVCDVHTEITFRCDLKLLCVCSVVHTSTSSYPTPIGYNLPSLATNTVSTLLPRPKLPLPTVSAVRSSIIGILLHFVLPGVNCAARPVTGSNSTHGSGCLLLPPLLPVQI
jgi:hypothetical protein